MTLLEGVLALSLLFPATLLSVEWARRGWIDPAFATASCSIARDSRWGLSSASAFRRAEPVLEAAVGEGGTRSVKRQSQPLREGYGGGYRARLHRRAPLLWNFFVKGEAHHHYEVTHSCLLP